MKNFFEIYNVLDLKQKKNLKNVTIYKFFESVLEVLSIGSIYPLIYLIFYGDLDFLKNFNIVISENRKELFIYVLLILLVIFFIKTLFFIFVSFKTNNFLTGITKDLQIKLLNKYLSQDYLFFLNSKSEKLLNNIITESVHFSKSQVQPIYVISNEFIKIFFIFILIVAVNPLATLFSILFFAPIIFLFLKKLKKKLLIIGKARQVNSENMIKFANKGLNSIREIILFKNQNFFLNKFNDYCHNLNSSSKQNNLWQEIPRILLEFFVVFYILSVFIVFFKFTSFPIEEIFVYLSFLSISFTRLLPSTNRIIKAVQDLNYYKNVTKIINSSIKLKKERNLKFNQANNLDFKTLQLKNINFSFKDKKIFDNASLKINSNKIYGINGESGSGKTTLINLLIGFLEPKNGNIFIDNKKLDKLKNLWQNNICYIPQDIYLLEDSIEKNITLSEEKSNKDKLSKALKLSMLDKLVKGYAKNVKHIIKSAGLDISGGQRQRIGIARSIYKDKKIIFLDESTNALDKKTEHEILLLLKNKIKNKTIFIISHNKSLYKYVDKIITIKNQKIFINNARY